MMNKDTVLTVFVAFLLGFIFFGVVMGLSMGLVTYNANTNPDFAWFPLPVTIILVGSVWAAEKKWGIGLEHPRDVPWTKVYIVGIGLTVLGIATACLQGKFTGYTRATELLDFEVDATFARTYAIYMSTLAAVLAEATFRGVVQARVQKVLSVWPTVILIGAVNVIAHRWGPEIIQNWLGLFVTLAGWTYLRWLSQSLWPPLILHTAVNLLVAIGLWYGGPLVHAEVSNGTLAAIVLAGVIGLVISTVLVKGMPRQPGIQA
jgi:membrane protease YdiL (CAAX protease family)